MTDSSITKPFASIDAGDVAGFVALFSEKATMTFGNNETVVGHDAIRSQLDAVMNVVDSLEHNVKHGWVTGSDRIAELAVTYNLPSGKSVTIPVSSIWAVDESGLITDYRVFADLAPVFA